MHKLFQYISKRPLSILLIAIPLTLIAEMGHWGTTWVFILSAMGIIPLAGYIGEATEELAIYTGPKVGGLLNATLGNAAELIITLAAIRAGLLELVKASITGSILGNLLLVLGMAMVLGGIKHGVQTFDRRHTANNTVLLVLSVVALVIPSIFSHTIGNEGDMKVEALSLGVALVMIILYGLGLLYSFKNKNSPITPAPAEIHLAKWSMKTALIVLVVVTAGVVWMSEVLVGAIDGVTTGLGLSEFFLGIILIPLIGNVAEHLVAVQVAIRNKMELSVEIAVASSLQIALFVAPLLVFISLLMGHPLTLIFNQFELLAVGAGIMITALVSMDGESHWLEGAALVAVYLILSLAFFLMPT